MTNESLLKTLPACEYPAEFLVARLQGKKGGLFRNWESLIASSDPMGALQHTPFYPYLRKYAPPGIWRFLAREHLWVYARMNPYLRRVFRPYFIYHELNILIKSLRFLHSRSEITTEAQQLQYSLLPQDIVKVLTRSQDFPKILETLETCLCLRSGIFSGLREHYEMKGFVRFEKFLRERFFSCIFSLNRAPSMKIFLQYLVDLHNCMSLAKSLRWQTETEPEIISGGTLQPEELSRAYSRRDLTPFYKSFCLQVPITAASSVTVLETALLRAISKELKKRAYQRTMINDILFYLWEQYRCTRNISIILNTLTLEDEAVRESIVA